MSGQQPTSSVSVGEASSGAEKRPYLTVVVGDFGAPGTMPNLTPIDKESFAAVLAAARPTPALAIKPPLGGGSDWEFRLALDSLRAMEPAAFLKSIPAGQWRLSVREKVAARQVGSISAGDLQVAFQAAAAGDSTLAWLLAADAAAGGGAAAAKASSGSILDQIAEPDAATRVAADVEALARSAGSAESRVSGAEAGRLPGILGRLDRELDTTANAVLKHPDFARVETAWRSLKLLIDRVDFREGPRVSVLHATRDEAIDRLITHVIEPMFEGTLATPGLVVFDYTFTNSPLDMEYLDTLAQHAAGVPMPVTFSLDAGFFGVKTLRLVKNLPNLAGLVDGWQFAKWKTLRDKPYSKSLAPVVGRFVLREPLAGKPGGTSYMTAETIASIDDVRWGGGHWAAAIAAARAVERHGWPTRMFGESSKLENLPVIPNPNDAQSPWGPGDFVLPDAKVSELHVVGVNGLISTPGKDFCMLVGGVSAARPIKTADNTTQTAALEVSLAYQQFSNIVGAFLCEFVPTLRGLGDQDLQMKLILGLRALLALQPDDPADSVAIGVGESPSEPGRKILQVRVSPPAKIAPGGLHVDFNFAL